MISGIWKSQVLWKSSQKKGKSTKGKSFRSKPERTFSFKFWYLILHSNQCFCIPAAKTRFLFFFCICVCIKFSQCDKLCTRNKPTILYPPCFHDLCSVTLWLTPSRRRVHYPTLWNWAGLWVPLAKRMGRHDFVPVLRLDQETLLTASLFLDPCYCNMSKLD